MMDEGSCFKNVMGVFLCSWEKREWKCVKVKSEMKNESEWHLNRERREWVEGRGRGVSPVLGGGKEEGEFWLEGWGGGVWWCRLMWDGGVCKWLMI